MYLARKANRARPAPEPEERWTLRSVVTTLAGNVVLWGLIALFGIRILVVPGALYVGYLLYFAAGDIRQSLRARRA
jgi:hypothetical protein